MNRKPWSAFTGITSKSFVCDLVPAARTVTPDDLMDMAEYRREERIAACGGKDPILIRLAYAQDKWVYDARGDVVTADNAAYAKATREERVNKFGLAYRRDAKFLLHKILADIVVGAAVHLHQTQGWTTVLYDGLRTVNGAYNLYLKAQDSDMESGLLSLPGQSAHNKGLACDSMMLDSSGREVDMGAHFDHLDMVVNSRLCDKISASAKQNRLVREAAFLRSAFSQGLLIAPLRNEFWDDRPPENREDLWRVLDSAARCIGINLLTQEDEAMRKTNHAAFTEKWERWSYADFLKHWQQTFRGHEKALEKILDTVMPPPIEKPEFYHGNYNHIYDEQLKASGKNLTVIPSEAEGS
ncbi:MAG: hypothetical protein KGJ06_10155 [Pseudomonadota bacterium]|nr:hypothetical protein [Pseudomonadota bacterium]